MSESENKDNLNEGAGSKLWRKTKEAPFVPIGIVGLIGALLYGAKTYRNRGQMSTSVYLMQYRVVAQSMVVGSITLGITATIIQKLWDRSHSDES